MYFFYVINQGKPKGSTYILQWTPQETEESINFLGMMAIYLALSYFSSRLRGQTILIRTDNSTCVSYLKHQGAPVNLPHLEVVPSLHESQHPVGSGTSSRQVELFGGSAQQRDQASSNRVGSQLSRFQSHHSKMGGTRNRLVHHQTEQAAAHLRQPLPGPSGVRHRHMHGLPHSSLSVPLPSVSHHTRGVTEGEAVRQHIPGHRAALASPVMVPRLNQSLRGSSPVPLTEGRSSGSGPSQVVLGSLQPGFVPIPRMAVVQEHLQQQVFRQALRTELPCLRETPQHASTMPSGRSFVVGAIDGKQILSQPMCP